MPKPTFFRLPAARRDRLVHEAIVEFGNRAFSEASLSQMALRADIPKGSFYQYFEDKLDLYRWLLTEEVPRQKRDYLGETAPEDDFWERLEVVIERGIGFLVEHPHLARLSAAAADPSAIAEVRGLHRSICEAGYRELHALVAHGLAQGAVYPRIEKIRGASRHVAAAVVRRAQQEGLATRPIPEDIPAFIDQNMWHPQFLPIRRRKGDATP